MAGTSFVAAAAAALAAAAAWTTGTPLEAPRTEVAAATLRGEIVVAGGFVASGGNSRRVDAYSPARDSWRRLPDLPVSVDHAAAASWRGKFYVVGGYGADRRPLRAAYVFDGTGWRLLPRPPDGRAAAAAAATSAGKLYVVGGRTDTGLAREMLVLDLRTLRWSKTAGPTGREHLAAASLGGVVYVLGGRRAGYDTNVATLESYDPRTRQLAPAAADPASAWWNGCGRDCRTYRVGRGRGARRDDRLRLCVRHRSEAVERTAKPPDATPRPRSRRPRGSRLGDRGWARAGADGQRRRRVACRARLGHRLEHLCDPGLWFSRNAPKGP